MLNYRSVTSSELQVRSKPALRFVSEKSGFQKRLSTLLEPTPLPFPTFQIATEGSRKTLEQHAYHAWVRPAHLRSQHIILADGFPVLLRNPKSEAKLMSLRIPFDKNRVQKLGPIVCEGAWDHQDHILWIWDILLWEKEIVWQTQPYSKRWDLVKTVVGELLDCGHPMSDAQVRVPVWETLKDIAAKEEPPSGYSIEFQPEKAGMRRHLLVLKRDEVAFDSQTYHERKMVASGAPSAAPITAKKQSHSPEPVVEPTAELSIPSASQPKPKAPQERRVARLSKDPHLKLPDTYRVKSVPEDEDLGLSAIRSMEISKALRLRFAKDESVLVDVVWYEPFQKWEVKQVHA
jgi:hypothetical protein